MITETTTREEYIEHLKKSETSFVVTYHLRKIENMTDEEWAAHRAKLIKLCDKERR